MKDTPWNNGTAPLSIAPYSMDADPSFSDAELREIRATWIRIAEDYAPFDVDVTTEIPAGSTRPSQSIEILFTPSSEWFGRAGGVCYIYSFSWEDSRKVCFVFSTLLGNRTKYIAEAGAHEVGHAFGLNHWARYNPDGNLAEAYASGQGDWAPIMGVGYYRNITTWSKGEYSGAGVWGLGENQDDLMGISQYLDYATDGGSATLQSARPLARIGGASSLIQTQGVIHRASELQYYRLDVGTPGLTLQIAPAALAPNLDLSAQLYNEAGELVADSNPPGVGAASLQLPELPAGTYYLAVTSQGEGNPATTGYTAYGSLGAYYITGQYFPGASEAGPELTEVNVINSDTDLNSLARYCDVSNLAATFYNEAGLGVGWGEAATHSATNADGNNPVPHQMQCCTLNAKIARVRVRMKTAPEPDYGKTGYLYVSRSLPASESSWGAYWTALSAPQSGGVTVNLDAWGGNWFGNTYQTAIVDLSHGRTPASQLDDVARDVVIDTSYASSDLQVCMSGDTNTRYNRRHISELTIWTVK